MIRHRFALAFLYLSLFTVSFACFAFQAQAQSAPAPESVLGFRPTDDKTIADWGQITNYFNKLDAASNRVAVREIGKTTLGKPFLVAFVSAPENIKNLEKLRQTNARLADPRTIKNPQELENLIGQGKTVVAIACSIHSTEIVASQMSMNLAFELANAKDAATLEILNNTILLLIPSTNPDGIDIVANWYRKTLNTPFEGTAPPELYHHYAGHDNNRDWFMLNLRETQLVTRLFWREWFPHIVYDVHQMGQAGARFVIPPFYDPPNPRISPLILREVGLAGYKMAADLQAAGVKGVATNTTFDTWWHGGFRSAPYYHNSIGILSEAASANLMSPVEIPTERLARTGRARGLNSPLETVTSHPEAWTGGWWRPRDIAQIEMVASRALLEMAAKFRPRYLRNFYELGRANLATKDADPQAFIIPAGQPNEETVARMLEILMAQGIEVFEMTNELYLAMTPENRQDFHEMPLGSFIVFTSQPQRNNVLSLFERQVYPQRLNADGSPDVPYDVAGWTLPLQMGVEAEAIWAIRDFAKYEKTLKRVESMNQVREVLNLGLLREPDPFGKMSNPLKTNPRIGLYKGFPGSMDEGWTRLVFDNFQIPYKSVTDTDFRNGNLNFDAIILPADSERSIVEGLRKGAYPDEFTGGITEAGVENLRKFVEAGGTLICFDDSCELAINWFKLPVKNTLKDLKRAEFYSPGSIMQINVDTQNTLARGLRDQTAAYFINSSAFEITDSSRVKSVAKYTDRDVLLSGWLLGEKFLNGKTALAEAEMGKGRVIMFAFRPQHRGQTFGTFPFVFNALEKR